MIRFSIAEQEQDLGKQDDKKKKGTVWAKFRTARTSRPTDGRGMFIATKEAHS
jgi:hypothetical protein